MKIDNKRELRQISFNHSTDFDYKGFIKIYKNVHVIQSNFLTIDTKLLANNSLRIGKFLYSL